VTSQDLPLLNAILNGSSGLLVLGGLASIRGEHRRRHRNFMLAALGMSLGFLVSYLTYHAMHGSTRFTHGGAVRIVYFTILISHTLLAAAVVPLIITTVTLALRRRWPRHRRWARITYPVWLYVSVTGVIIYLMLYQWFTPAGAL
jgi:putative membrane protein